MCISLQGYKQSGTYIATQGPLESTVNDFWRMVWEYESKCIVMLCDLTEDEEVWTYFISPRGWYPGLLQSVQSCHMPDLATCTLEALGILETRTT